MNIYQKLMYKELQIEDWCKTIVYDEESIIQIDADIENLPEEYKGFPTIQVITDKDNPDIIVDIKCLNFNGWSVKYYDNKFFVEDPTGVECPIGMIYNMSYTVEQSSFDEAREKAFENMEEILGSYN